VDWLQRWELEVICGCASLGPDTWLKNGYPTDCCCFGAFEKDMGCGPGVLHMHNPVAHHSARRITITLSPLLSNYPHATMEWVFREQGPIHPRYLVPAIEEN